MQKPGIPEGTRDFGPEQVRKRNYLFDTIRSVFVKFGFQPLETPAMENLSTLTGKYGDEGDKLLFKILNNGDFLKDADPAALQAADSSKLLPAISRRGLRYDLTVPFARFVVMNRHHLAFPFKRYQIQPVWRADRPQKGRYREFFQCDADVIGSESLQYEAELIQIYDEAFATLSVPVTIKINNRKVLYGIAEAAGIPNQFMDMTVAIDKLDKIGMDGVEKELQERGIDAAAIGTIQSILQTPDLASLRGAFSNSPTGLQGIEELEKVYQMLAETPLQNTLQFDITLARGLSYYTGCIIEVAAVGVKMGSIGGGGRYADLTGVFGVPGLSGVGVSFGADRIYDVMETLGVFPDTLDQTLKILFVSFDEAAHQYAFGWVSQLRKAGIAADLYPEPGKLKKQFDFAAKRNAQYVAIVGDEEMKSGKVKVKDQASGDQDFYTLAELTALLRFLICSEGCADRGTSRRFPEQKRNRFSNQRARRVGRAVGYNFG
ncbi:MAG: histidine--tRNA ligase [Lewinellaceae bacterium]|nr:histidine--tRNA ligase [Lewinellaceae bacterium]